jgi:hypothetical protein
MLTCYHDVSCAAEDVLGKLLMRTNVDISFASAIASYLGRPSEEQLLRNPAVAITSEIEHQFSCNNIDSAASSCIIPST